MRKIFIILAILLLSGCNLLDKGADVCQDDDCFFELAEFSLEQGNREQAEQFCQAIEAVDRENECNNLLNK